MFTVDTSVHVNALNPSEEGSGDSQAFLEQVHKRPWPVFSPTLLLVEIATAVARAKDDAGQGIAVGQAVRGLPGQVWVPLDVQLADDAAQLGAEYRLRGADAVYAAVARQCRTTLVTRDRQQLERLSPVLVVLSPSEALARLAAMAAEDEE
jgi:predicted nucleic acid-binding protein